MVSAFLVTNDGAGLPRVIADLEAAGIAIAGSGEVRTMVADVIRTAPDLVVCYESHPDDALFKGTEALNRSAPRPVVMFTSDPDVDKIERATRAGIHAYVVNGYAATRLRSVLHVAQARFRYVEVLRSELAEIHHRFSERKLIDQAKAILMRLRNLPEDEAYAVLRSAAMKANRRMGQIARQVIDAARYGEAINRAGQLRMFSQRLAKLYALRAADAETPAALLFEETVGRVDGILTLLAKTLSKPTFGDLLDAVAQPWASLRAAAADPPSLDGLPAVDAAAERLLIEAEQLTASLETAGFQSALRLINVAGRQRMLSQRLAKQALIAAMLPAQAMAAERLREATAREYQAAMVYLAAVPLSTPTIAGLFAQADAAFAALAAAMPAAARPDARAALLEASEALLAAFDDLTDQYERNLQVLTHS